MIELETDRLILRPFLPSDVSAFGAINADPKVMEHFPKVLNLEETAQRIESATQKWHRDGYGFSAMILKETGALIGMNGLSVPTFPSGHFLDGITEIGWRLAAGHWGKGLASEGARRWLQYGFEDLDLGKIGSFASARNKASFAVMDRIGMTRVAGSDFIHPDLPHDSPLQPLYYYRIDRPDC